MNITNYGSLGIPRNLNHRRLQYENTAITFSLYNLLSTARHWRGLKSPRWQVHIGDTSETWPALSQARVQANRPGRVGPSIVWRNQRDRPERRPNTVHRECATAGEQSQLSKNYHIHGFAEGRFCYTSNLRSLHGRLPSESRIF